jgi:hypothetical protein
MSRLFDWLLSPLRTALQKHKIETLLRDREAFTAFVYSSVEDALDAIRERSTDMALKDSIASLMEMRVPEQFGDCPRAVLARHVITPNYETIRFLNVPDSTGLEPLFFEYHQDKLVYKNPGKYHLARMSFDLGRGKSGGQKHAHVRLVDFNNSHGKPIRSVETLFGMGLVDLHHSLFLAKYPGHERYMFDGSTWYAEHGGKPELYYEKFLGLFVAHGILFENFLLDQKEYEFTRQVFLPAFMEVIRKTGKKPLIVPLEATHIEGDEFWLSYPESVLKAAIGLGIPTGPQELARA